MIIYGGCTKSIVRGDVCFAYGTNQWEQQEWPWIDVETDANDEENVQIEISKDIENI